MYSHNAQWSYISEATDESALTSKIIAKLPRKPEIEHRSFVIAFHILHRNRIKCVKERQCWSWVEKQCFSELFIILRGFTYKLYFFPLKNGNYPSVHLISEGDTSLAQWSVLTLWLYLTSAFFLKSGLAHKKGEMIKRKRDISCKVVCVFLSISFPCLFSRYQIIPLFS